MKIVLVTTTINVPHVLKWYRAIASISALEPVEFIVVGDRKTPRETEIFCAKIPNCRYISCAEQEVWKCSDPTGWVSIQRRNIGFLEALKAGADTIVSVDDDNMGIDLNYFDMHEIALGYPFDGMQITGKNGWVDPGAYLRPQAKHRGFPTQKQHAPAYAPIVDAKVGVSAGMCIGDPDIDAVTRIANAPDVQQVSLLAEAGFVVNCKSWTVFNSQNTAVLREYIPAWGMIPFVGRYDDIFASLIVQRVMRDRQHHVRFGKPYAFQERNEHDLIRDLRGELEGMENVVKLADVLDHTLLANKSVLADCRQIWRTLSTCSWMPIPAVKAMEAYLDDCEAVL